jgi:uncharacterized protein YjbI with pentapeptide repeats
MRVMTSERAIPRDFQEKLRRHAMYVAGKTGGARLAVSEVDLSGCTLDEMNFKGAGLSASDFSKSSCLLTDFSESDLFGSNFSWANLKKAAVSTCGPARS